MSEISKETPELDKYTDNEEPCERALVMKKYFSKLIEMMESLEARITALENP